MSQRSRTWFEQVAQWHHEAGLHTSAEAIYPGGSLDSTPSARRVSTFCIRISLSAAPDADADTPAFHGSAYASDALLSE